MSELVMQLADVIQRDLDSLRDVAHNVANANTTGYKSARAFNHYLTGAGGEVGIAGIQGGRTVDITGGALQLSGEATDLALSGDAWFVLQTGQGQRLTRDGRFQVSSDGVLSSMRGEPVLGVDGPLQVAGGSLAVDGFGALSLDGQVIGQLLLVKLDSSQQIRALGNGLYDPGHSALMAATNFTLRQGARERSNVDLGSDMVKVMEASRHIESMQRALSAYDALLDSGINQLGKE